MTAQQRTEDAKTRTMIRLLATFGVLAPLAFAASALTQSLARDEHNLLRDPISALAAGPAGWVQDVTDDNAPHTIAGFIAFGSAGPAALALARRLSRDPRWADLARYVRVVGVVLLLLFLALGVLA